MIALATIATSLVEIHVARTDSSGALEVAAREATAVAVACAGHPASQVRKAGSSLAARLAEVRNIASTSPVPLHQARSHLLHLLRTELFADDGPSPPSASHAATAQPPARTPRSTVTGTPVPAASIRLQDLATVSTPWTTRLAVLRQVQAVALSLTTGAPRPASPTDDLTLLLSSRLHSRLGLQVRDTRSALAREAAATTAAVFIALSTTLHRHLHPHARPSPHQPSLAIPTSLAHALAAAIFGAFSSQSSQSLGALIILCCRESGGGVGVVAQAAANTARLCAGLLFLGEQTVVDLCELVSHKVDAVRTVSLACINRQLQLTLAEAEAGTSSSHAPPLLASPSLPTTLLHTIVSPALADHSPSVRQAARAAAATSSLLWPPLFTQTIRNRPSSQTGPIFKEIEMISGTRECKERERGRERWGGVVGVAEGMRRVVGVRERQMEPDHQEVSRVDERDSRAVDKEEEQAQRARRREDDQRVRTEVQQARAAQAEAAAAAAAARLQAERTTEPAPTPRHDGAGHTDVTTADSLDTHRSGTPAGLDQPAALPVDKDDNQQVPEAQPQPAPLGEPKAKVDPVVAAPPARAATPPSSPSFETLTARLCQQADPATLPRTLSLLPAATARKVGLPTTPLPTSLPLAPSLAPLTVQLDLCPTQRWTLTLSLSTLLFAPTPLARTAARESFCEFVHRYPVWMFPTVPTIVAVVVERESEEGGDTGRGVAWLWSLLVSTYSSPLLLAMLSHLSGTEDVVGSRRSDTPPAQPTIPWCPSSPLSPRTLALTLPVLNHIVQSSTLSDCQVDAMWSILAEMIEGGQARCSPAVLYTIRLLADQTTGTSPVVVQSEALRRAVEDTRKSEPAHHTLDRHGDKVAQPQEGQEERKKVVEEEEEKEEGQDILVRSTEAVPGEPVQVLRRESSRTDVSLAPTAPATVGPGLFTPLQFVVDAAGWLADWDGERGGSGEEARERATRRQVSQDLEADRDPAASLSRALSRFAAAGSPSSTPLTATTLTLAIRAMTSPSWSPESLSSSPGGAFGGSSLIGCTIELGLQVLAQREVESERVRAVLLLEATLRGGVSSGSGGVAYRRVVDDYSMIILTRLLAAASAEQVPPLPVASPSLALLHRIAAGQTVLAPRSVAQLLVTAVEVELDETLAEEGDSGDRVIRRLAPPLRVALALLSSLADGLPEHAPERKEVVRVLLRAYTAPSAIPGVQTAALAGLVKLSQTVDHLNVRDASDVADIGVTATDVWAGETDEEDERHEEEEEEEGGVRAAASSGGSDQEGADEQQQKDASWWWW